MSSVETSIYSPAFVQSLFDEMSATYGVVNVVSSLGFCVWWRRQCVAAAELRPGMTVFDLMCGMGECWPAIRRRIGPEGRIIGVDLSSSMCRRARQLAERMPAGLATVVEGDALELAADAPNGTADAVVACFAVKTLDPPQQIRFAREIARLLRPGGRFAVLEISAPPSRLLRTLYRLYLHHVIPQLGRLFLGNPDNYRMLGRYTDAFGNCDRLHDGFAGAGLTVTARSHFFGCATSISGAKT